MKARHFSVTARIAIIIAASYLASCVQQAVLEAPPHQPASVPVFEQARLGAEASWIPCAPPDCSVHTPKTLASPEAVSLPIAPAKAHQEGDGSLFPNPGEVPSSADVAPQAWVVPFEAKRADLSQTARLVVGLASTEIIAAGRITVIGYPDADQAGEGAKKLAAARAQAVRDALARIRPSLATSITPQVELGSPVRALDSRAAIFFEPTLPP